MTPRRLIATVAALGAAALAVPAAAAAPTAAPVPATTSSATSSSAATIAAYTGSAADQAATKAFYDAVWSSVKSRGKPTPGTVTVTYNASKAPSFRTEIGKTQTIWNGSVTRVKLAEVTGAADFEYREGNDPRGSYASTDGRGHGYVFLDYEQNQVYNSTRVTSHETGHILGLPDHYSGPCSELMSGGGPGPSCTNAYPDATERAKVDRLWSRGGALAEAAFVTVR